MAKAKAKDGFKPNAAVVNGIKKFLSLNDVCKRAREGEEKAQRCIVGALSNFGCDHLARHRYQCRGAGRTRSHGGSTTGAG